MTSVCFYFQVHQPYRLRRYSLFDIGSGENYFDDNKNRDVLLKVSRKCYLPMNRLLLDLIAQHRGRFKIAFSITGVAIEQFRDHAPEVLRSFQELARTGCVEFLSETYHHSLSYLYSKTEFAEQVAMHRRLLQELFGQSPTVFRNTELIYNNELATYVERLGYRGILAEGWDAILGWRSPNFLYRAVSASGMKMLLKNYKLSDDIAFRFGNKAWDEHPLTVEKYGQWLSASNGNGHTINLFMDYETFGEHQWEDTGIFEFMRRLPNEILRHPDNEFLTPSQAIDKYEPVGTIDARAFVSWADVERDLSAWLGNKLQHAAIRELYKLEQRVKATRNESLINTWRRLTTSDHFYYMCTKWFADGDVHKYFNPYESPYEAYIAYMNVLQDLRLRVEDLEAVTGPTNDACEEITEEAVSTSWALRSWEAA